MKKMSIIIAIIGAILLILAFLMKIIMHNYDYNTRLFTETIPAVIGILLLFSGSVLRLWTYDNDKNNKN
jgi:uncharacterized membrane protein